MGRTKKYLVQTSIRLPQQDMDKVRRIADKQGTYPADVIRNLLTDKLTEIKA